MLLKKSPEEGLSVILRHLDADLLPGLVSRAGPEASLVCHSSVQPDNNTRHEGGWELVRRQLLEQIQRLLVHRGAGRDGVSSPCHEVQVPHHPAHSAGTAVHVKQEPQLKPAGLLELLRMRV